MDQLTKLRRSANATYQVVAGEAILIRLDTGTYFSLNKIGTEFWDALDGAQTIAGHAAAIAKTYDVEEALVTADLLELAGKMAADKLVDEV